MNEEQKKLCKKILTIFLISLSLGIMITLVKDKINANSTKKEVAGATPTNWEGLLMLGLIPESASRDILPGDETIGIIKSETNIYWLMRSRNFETGDYGKTFVVKQ